MHRISSITTQSHREHVPSIYFCDFIPRDRPPISGVVETVPKECRVKNGKGRRARYEFKRLAVAHGEKSPSAGRGLGDTFLITQTPSPCCSGDGGAGHGKASGACGRPSLSYLMRRSSSMTRSASWSVYPARSSTEGEETPRKSISSPCEMPSHSPDSK